MLHMMLSKTAIPTHNDELSQATAAVAHAIALVNWNCNAAMATEDSEDFNSSASITWHCYGTDAQRRNSPLPASPVYHGLSPVSSETVKTGR